MHCVYARIRSYKIFPIKRSNTYMAFIKEKPAIKYWLRMIPKCEARSALHLLSSLIRDRMINSCQLWMYVYRDTNLGHVWTLDNYNPKISISWWKFWSLKQPTDSLVGVTEILTYIHEALKNLYLRATI